jgi:hypothetical protein
MEGLLVLIASIVVLLVWLTKRSTTPHDPREVGRSNAETEAHRWGSF